MESWSRAVLEWVNCLDILDTNINDLRELQDGKFCAKLIKILSETESQDDGDDRDLITRFIKDKYPEFLGKSTEEEKNHKEIHIVSLLLLHSSHEPKLHRPMCIKLSNETQIKIKSFLEKVLEYGSSVTSDNINTAIMETTENFVRTPPATPKMRTLKDFFNSPATTVRKNYNKIMDERTREIRSLKAELETERFEKADLREDLEIQRQKNLSLQQKLQEKMTEIKMMREESVRFDTPQSSKKKNDIKTPRVRLNAKLRDLTEEVTLLKSEIINLQDEKQSLMRKLASVERSCITFKERSKMNERNLETLLIQADIKDQEIAELKNHNEELRSHIQEMRRQTIAEQSFEMEMTTMSASNSSLNGSEILSSVIDIQLQEAKEESKVFKFQVEDLNRRLESVQGDYQVLQQSNQTLEAEVRQFKCTKQQLNEVRKELNKYIDISKTLETEKVHFEEQTKKFETLFLSKQKLLEQSEQRNKQTVEDLRDLQDRLKTTHDLLSREKDSIKNLEALIFDREEMLKTEYLRYEDLDQKYAISEQKNSDILEQVKDLENLVSSRENSLSQAQKQTEILGLDLQNLKDKLKNVQDLFRTEKTRVKDLESMISQVKLEHEETLKIELLRYRSLKEKYVNLEREREDLNFKITSSENLWRESLERNENLASNLRDLNGKLQTTENRLAEEKKRVGDLESAVTQVETDKREFIESQFLKYQTLEDEYVNLEKENLRLIKDIEDLNNVVSLKEKSIKQCWKERENLESTLQDLNEKFSNLQDSLGKERTRVQDLESTITRIKQENQEILQQQLTSYQALEKIHTNVEEEKMSLTTEINRLKSLIFSKEELLEQFRNQNGEFEMNLRKLNGNLLTVQGLLNVESTKVNDLESTLSQIKLQHEQTVQGETARYKELEEKYVNLENEKVNLLQETKNLNHKIAEKENLLTQVREEEEHLISKLGDLNVKLQSVQNSLAEERSRVADLESTLIRVKQEREEIVETQAMSYQSLEKKYVIIEEEKLDLLKNTENLDNLLSSKEELLQQLQQHNSKLEVDLCDVNGELNSATTKVKSLESALAETKLEIDKIIQSNGSLHAEISLLKSAKDDLYQVKEQLHKETDQLDQERSRLLEEIEKLKTHAASKEEILRRTQQQNEALQSKLKDLNEEVKSVQNLLSAKSNRVEELESTIMHIEQEKEEMLQSQLTNYQSLEKKLIDAEQQKLELLKDTENLKNLLFSKEELLQQSQQDSVKLESDLHNTKRELQTVQNELDTATANIKRLKSELAETKLETDEIILSNESLHAKISLLKSAKVDLYNAKEQLYKQSQELEQEKSTLLEKIEELTTHASAKEELLRQTRQQNEALQLKLKDLDEEVKSVHNLLSAKSSRIKDLESVVFHIKQEKEETLQSQLMSYQALEKKHMDVEQEKLDLLQDTENLKNVIVSKEEILQQSQEHSAKLEGDLCDAKSEMKTMQDEIEAVTTKVKSLESAFAETKLETQKIILSNESLHAEISLLKSARDALDELRQQLHKQSEELEQEKSRLEEEIEELKTHAISKEELLKQTHQQNEDLQSKLNDLNEEMKSLQNLLSMKSTRVESLESILAETESERQESLSIIEKLNLENAEHTNLIRGCTLILTELVKCSSQLTGNEITDIGDSTILDLSKQLKTLINSLQVIHNTKNSDLKNFEATVSALDLTVSKLKTDVIHFEEMKMKDDKVISEYLKEITNLRVIAEEKDTILENMDKLKHQLSDERSKIDLLNEEKILLGESLLDVKRSLISLKNEKSVLVENVKNQNQDFLTKMRSISEVIVKMQDQISIDNDVILRLSEEKTLSDLKYDEEKKVKANLEMKCESLENENKSHAKEKKELKDKLNVIRVRNAKLEKNLDELRKENKKLGSEKPSTEDESKLEELNTSISKLQLQIQELEAEKIELSKRPTEQEFDSRIKEMHVEYNEKLEKIKQKMKMAYNEQIAKVNRDQERLMQEKVNAQRVKMEEQCRKHAEEITKYKDHVTKLSSDYWDVGEKLLVEKQQKEQIAQQLQDLKIRSQYQRISAAHSSMSQPASTARSKTSSLDRREFPTTNRDELSASRTVATIKEEVSTCPRRESIQSVQAMQGMGNAFKVEDEEGEVFNTNYLADMKAGRCALAPDLDRLSVLQLRNAQCKPHLKSSYPAETQFQPESFTEEEIKSGSTIEDVFNDSLSQSLLPGEKTKKRDRTQTLYKRPGPPTPSKNGGRLSLQGNESRSPNSRILRERNVERRSTATPRRLKDLFGGSSRRQDENVSGTPNRRRLSSIFRKPK